MLCTGTGELERNMTHKEITKRAAKWLKKHSGNVIVPNCSTVAEDLTTATVTGEIPDVIGWCSWTSVLIEVKVSRSDFLRDIKKPFRKFADMGMGEHKYYLCPEGLITEDDLPELWGLLWIDEKGKISIQKKAEKHEANLRCERTVLLSLHRRAKSSACT